MPNMFQVDWGDTVHGLTTGAEAADGDLSDPDTGEPGSPAPSIP
jgi:hypothetical protein